MRQLLIFALLVFPHLLCAEETRPFNERAYERYRTILFSNPTDGAAMDRFWEEAVAGGRTKTLIAEAVEASGRGEYSGAMILGHLRKRLGDLEGATEAYRSAAKLKEGALEAWRLLAAVEESRGRAEEAAKVLEIAADGTGVPPADRSVLRKEAARLYAAADNTEAALVLWEKIAADDPRQAGLRRELARQYEAAGRESEALAQLRLEVENSAPRERVEALRELARIHQFSQDNAAASAALEEALSLLGPGHWMFEETLGQLIRMHQLEQTEDTLAATWEQALERNPRDTDTLFKLVLLRRMTLDLEGELALLERLPPPAALRDDVRGRRADLLVELGRPGQARPLREALVADRPGNVDLVFALAELDLQMQQEQEAVARLEALRAGLPSDAVALSRILEFYQQNRLHEAAKRVLKERMEAGGRKEADVLAFAAFEFENGTAAAAQELLLEWAKTGDPAERAGRLEGVAAVLRENNEVTKAESLLKEASGLDATNFEIWMALTDVQSQLALPEAARESAARAYAVAVSDADQLAADEKLMQTFQVPPPAPGVAPTAPPGLAAFVETLRLRAEQSNGAGDWLRLSRWQNGGRTRQEALRSLRKATLAEPGHVPSLTRYAALLEEEGQYRAAIDTYVTLAGIVPEEAEKRRWQREQARIEGVLGNWADAVKIYQTLSDEQPGSARSLGDLATALRAQGGLPEALEIYRKALALPPGPEVRDLVQPYIALLEENGEHDEALAFLLRESKRAGDSARQWSLFQAALLYSQRVGRLEELHESLKKQLRSDPANPMLLAAMAAILQSKGDEELAVALLETSSIASSDPTRALEALVQSAEQAGNLEEAVRHQRRLVMLSPQDAASRLRKLAALQEANFDFRDAANTWDRLSARYPRDPGVLREAADFYLRIEDDTAAGPLLEELLRLERSSAEAAFALAQIRLRAGDSDAALVAAREAVERGPIRAAAAPFITPGFEPDDARRAHEAASLLTVRRSLGWGSYGEAMRHSRWPQRGDLGGRGANSEEEARLAAIRLTGLLLAAETRASERAQWVALWKSREAEQAMEAIWAYYYAGATDAAIALLEKLTGADNSGEFLFHYVTVAARLGAAETLPEWIWARERPNTQLADLAQVALLQRLLTDPHGVNSEWLARLFPEARTQSGLRLQAASVLAANQRVDLAVEQARLVWTQQQGAALASLGEIADWFLRVGDIEGVAKLVDQAAMQPETGLRDGRTFALRTAFYLQAPALREAWSARVRGVAKETGLVAGTLTELVLAGLSNHAAAIQQASARIVRNQLTFPRGPEGNYESTPEAAPWILIGETLESLQQFGLSDAVRQLSSEALSDAGLIALLEPDAAVHVEMLMMQQLVRELSGASMERIRAAAAGRQVRRINPSLRIGAPGEWVQRNEALTAARWHRALAAQSDETVSENVRQMMAIYRSIGEWVELREALLELNPESMRKSDSNSLQFEILAGLVEAESSLGLHTLAAGRRGAPPLRAVSGRINLARNLRGVGRQKESIALLEEVINTNTRNPLLMEEYARSLQADGRDREALEVFLALEPVDRAITGSAARLSADLVAAQGTPAEIRRMARRFAKTEEVQALATLAANAPIAERPWLFQVLFAAGKWSPMATGGPGENLATMSGIITAAPDAPAFWRAARRFETAVRDEHSDVFFHDIMSREALRQGLDLEWEQELAASARAPGAESSTWAEYLLFAAKRHSLENVREAGAALIELPIPPAARLAAVVEALENAGERATAARLLDRALERGATGPSIPALRLRIALLGNEDALAAKLHECLRVWGLVREQAWLELVEAYAQSGRREKALEVAGTLLPMAQSVRGGLLARMVRLHTEARQFPAAAAALRGVDPAVAGELVTALVMKSLRFDLVSDYAAMAELTPQANATMELAVFDAAMTGDRFDAAAALCQQSPLLLARVTAIRREAWEKLRANPQLAERLDTAVAKLPDDLKSPSKE